MIQGCCYKNLQKCRILEKLGGIFIFYEFYDICERKEKFMNITSIGVNNTTPQSFRGITVQAAARETMLKEAKALRSVRAIKN